MISIVIPTYNNKPCLEKTLKSIFTQQSKGIEVIVVDNGSQDGTYPYLKKYFPQIKIIKNEKNMGACYARNQGMKIAEGDYTMFMDCDVELEKDFFLKLERVLANLPSDVGGISPKIINKTSQKIFSCGLLISSIYRTYDIGKNKSPQYFSSSFYIDGPNSCCAIFKREVLEKIKEKNYFDEDLFFLFEDADLALRLKKKGYNSLFIPELLCFHYGNSSHTAKQKRRYLCFRNRWYIILKNHRGKKLFKFLGKSFFYDFPRTIHFFLTDRYAYLILKDLLKKFRDEKNYHL